MKFPGSRKGGREDRVAELQGVVNAKAAHS